MKKYGYINDSQFEWYSSSFLQKLYNSPIIDEEERIKSSSIYEEESVKSEKNKIIVKTKRANNKNNYTNNLRTIADMRNNMNEFDLIYNKNMISSKNIKQKMLIDKFGKPEYKNIIMNSNDNYINEEIWKRKRLSSY